MKPTTHAAPGPRVFVLPAWYPSAAMPMAGLFVREQVSALAAAGARVGVGTWGHHQGALSPRQPLRTLRALAWRAAARPAVLEPQDVDARWLEALTPRLSWSLAWRGGGASGLLAASRANLAAVRQRLGGIDLIHAHVGFPAGWIAARLRAETGLPVVLTEHQCPFPGAVLADAQGRPNAALREAYAAAAAVVAVSPALAGEIAAGGLRCDVVLPNVADERRIALAPPRPAAAPGVWLAIGALVPRKGFDTLLHAFAQWAAADAAAPGCELHIAGDGPERAALQALAAQLGLQRSVRFLGALAPAAVSDALAGCDAFVLASQHETFGVVLAEALLAGRPVLATACGGPQAIVGPGDGLLVPPGDAAALAAGMGRVWAMRSGFDAAAARQRALARFGRAAVAQRLLALYARVQRGERVAEVSA